jgi:DNA-binding beta-propeller fold protein YncE
MTTRKKFRTRSGAPVAFAMALACYALGAAGCATPGPLHVYTIAPGQPAVVHDTSSDAPAVNVPDFLADGETLTGFAYDPFTDHFFLRLAPGNRIRVIDRPARAVKREFKVAELSTAGGGDLAIRPRNGHLYIAHPAEPTLIEVNRFGEFVRALPLTGFVGAPAGVAFDAAHDRLLVLAGGGASRVSIYDPDGRLLATISLDRPVASGALGYDAEQHEYYAPLADGGAVGVFGEDGRLRRTLPLTAAWLDVGPRSFLRVF